MTTQHVQNETAPAPERGARTRRKETTDELNRLPKNEARQIVLEYQAANTDLFPSDDASRLKLWNTLIVGLFAIAILGMALSAWLMLEDQEVAPMIGLATAALSGLIGLFAKSPVEKG